MHIGTTSPRRGAAATLALLVAGAARAAATGSAAGPIDADAARAWQEHAEQHQQRVAEALAASDRPRDWMTAAKLLDRRPPGQRARDAWDARGRVSTRAEALVARALAAGDDDRLVLWTAATNCPVARSVCNPARALARLRALEPENAAVWAVGLRHADDGGRAAAEDAPARAMERLRRIAAASRYDSQFGERQRHYFEVFGRVPPSAALAAVPESHRGELPASPELAIAILAFGHGMAEPLVDGLGVGRLCGRQARERLVATGGDPRAHRDACLAAATRVVALADTVLAHRMATSILLQLVPSGPARQRVLRQRRAVEWMSSAAAQLLQGDGEAAPLSKTWIALWQRPAATEVTVLRDGLIAAGIALEPPPRWNEQAPVPQYAPY